MLDFIVVKVQQRKPFTTIQSDVKPLFYVESNMLPLLSWRLNALDPSGPLLYYQHM